jgi:hypothetical protein
MNPIALIEATATARSAMLGALATDPVVPGRKAGTARPPRKPSLERSTIGNYSGRHIECTFGHINEQSRLIGSDQLDRGSHDQGPPRSSRLVAG